MKEKQTGAAPEKKAAKVPMDGKYIAKLTSTLLGITLVTSLLLGVVNYMTAPVIATAKAEKEIRAMQQVLEAETYPAVEDFAPEGFTWKSGAGTATVTNLYEAASGGATAGYVAKVTTNGFGGAIEMMVGLDAEGYVTGVSVMSNGETPGVGSKVVKDQKVLDRFLGMTGEITVNSGENAFDGVTGATVSSKAVTAGVNAAVQAVAQMQA